MSILKRELFHFTISMEKYSSLSNDILQIDSVNCWFHYSEATDWFVVSLFDYSSVKHINQYTATAK